MTSSSIQRCILSIDVGVKNLAICVLTQSATSTNIVLWNLYNVTDEVKVKKKPVKKTDDSTGPCQNIIKRTNKPCGKTGVLNSRGRAYCGTHDPTRKHTPDDTQNWCFSMLKTLPNITNDIIASLKSCVKTAGTPTSDNSTTDNSTSYDDIISRLEVIIEQQAMDNKKILLQSHIIFGHFVKLFNNTVPVRFTPAYNKLLVYQGPEIQCTLKTPYARRKFYAKKHTEYFLKNESPLTAWLPFFESCKSKQDDISDAFLQGLYILRKKNLAPRKEVTETGKPRRRRKVRF